MRIAICDDSAQDRYLLAGYLERFFVHDRASLSVTQFSGAQLLLDAMTDSVFDVVFLDIFMRGKNGMEAAHQMRAEGYDGAIVFTTSSTDYAVEGYQVEAAYYLVKPYTYTQLCTAVEKLTLRHDTQLRYLTVTEERIRRQVPLRDVLWIEAGDHCAYLHMRSEVVRAGTLLSQLCDELAETRCFIRCNRGVAVNVEHVMHCDAEFIYLDSEERLQMNLRNSLKIRQQIHDYRWNRLRKQL